MAFGFPAYHTESCTPKPADGDVKTAVKEAIERLSWKIKEETSDEIKASTSINFWSWGEKVTIEFDPDGSVVITSKCSMPTQCIDWGKNKRNVQKLIDELP